jgi:hypothetical protein
VGPGEITHIYASRFSLVANEDIRKIHMENRLAEKEREMRRLQDRVVELERQLLEAKAALTTLNVNTIPAELSPGIYTPTI